MMSHALKRSQQTISEYNALKIINSKRKVDNINDKLKIFFSESGVKYGVGKCPSKFSRLLNELSGHDNKAADFSLSVSGLSFIEHFAGVVQYILRSRSFHKNHETQKKQFKLFCELTNHIKKIEFQLGFLKLKKSLLKEQHNFFLHKKTSLKIRNERRIRHINRYIEKMKKHKKQLSDILTELKAPFYNSAVYKKKISQSFHDFCQAVAYILNYGLKLVKDILQMTAVFVVKHAKYILHIFSHLISTVVYPVSLFFALYKTHQDVKNIEAMSSLYVKAGKDIRMSAIKGHFLSKRSKSIASMLGNFLSALGYLFACISALCYFIVPGAVVASSIVTPVGWALAGAGALVLLGLLVYRLVNYYHQRKVKNLCLDVLNNKTESVSLYKSKYGLESMEDGEIKKHAMDMLCKTSAQYAVLDLITRTRKQCQMNNWEKSPLHSFLKTLFVKKSERKTFLSRSYKDQVVLLCEKLKIKTVVKSPLQYQVFEGLSDKILTA